MQTLRFIHRSSTLLIVLVTLFLSVTGLAIQFTDLRSIYTGAPATDANVRAMRESFDGPPDYAVRATADYLAKPLPANAPFPEMLDRVMHSVRAKLGDAPLKYVDLRMAGDVPVGRVGIGDGHASFDATTGAFIEQTQKDPKEPQSPVSDRNTFKSLHRMTTFGDWALYINIVAALALGTLIVTGVWIYLKLLIGRRNTGRNALFWSAGGLWRTLHRIVSVVAAAFLVVVTLSGSLLATESLYRSFDVKRENAGPPPAPPPPLRDEQLPEMLKVTLGSLSLDARSAPIKVVRLRNYGIYRQGVVVTGGKASKQLVFNAETGAAMTETEPGYPRVHFPFGWQSHQWAKNVHRGDIIGLTGRWMDVLAGAAMLYLSVSGIEMYWSMWRKRAKAGRKAMVWK